MRLEPRLPHEVLDAVRAPFRAAGGLCVETPVAEPLGVYLDLAGEALRERLFLVQGAEREDHCLRPDFTVGIVRAHLAGGAGSARYVYEGPAFRVAPPGSARSEQFLQIGLEAFEPGDVAEADAQTALLGWRAASAGGREDLSLVLNDVSLFAAFLEAVGVEVGAASRLKRSLAHPNRLERQLADMAAPDGGALAGLLAGRDDAEAVLEEIWALSGIEPVGGRSAADIVGRLAARSASRESARLSDATRALIRRYLAIADEPAAALAQIGRLARGEALDGALDAWSRRLKALADIPVDRMRLAAGFHRPFGYYDGLLFEVRSAALGEDQAVAAGGRYDSLPMRLGASLTTGAVGCMVRPARAWKDAAA